MKSALKFFDETLDSIREAGTFKEERELTGRQSSRISTTTSNGVINMCANNYLGLAASEELITAAKAGMDQWGYGLSSVRFICGTQSVHKQLEDKISQFLGMEDTILYSSCFDANGGIFETLLGEEDAIISDELNHASIIDGVRLSKAKRFRYKNNDMQELERCLKEAATARIRLVVTDGVFSMDGTIANLSGICDLAERYDALVMVDDSHAVGFMGEHGRGTHEHCGVMGRVDIITGTLGKALGGASGGFTAASRGVVTLLRQRSRPYLFSNTLAPAIAAGSIKAIELAFGNAQHREQLFQNTRYFREKMKHAGFDIIDSTHPIVAVMFYDAKVATAVAKRMLDLGVYVIGFTYPVVPMGKARIRTQVSAAHTREELDFVVECFTKVKGEMGL